jgi:hypothetical protein
MESPKIFSQTNRVLIPFCREKAGRRGQILAVLGKTAEEGGGVLSLDAELYTRWYPRWNTSQLSCPRVGLGKESGQRKGQ